MDLLEFTKSGILGYGEEYFENALTAPAYFYDLNLDQIIRYVANERKAYDLSRYFNRLPKDRAVAKERGRVLRALEDEALLDGFLRFSDQLMAARKYAGRYRSAQKEIQRRRFLLDCGTAYVEAVETLKGAFLAREESSAALPQLLCSLKAALEEYTAAPEYQKLCECTAELADGFSGLRVQAAIVRDKLKITKEEDINDNYSKKLKQLFPEQADREEFFENPFQAAKEPGEFESLMIEVFRKNNPELFEKLKNYEKIFSEKEEEAIREKEENINGRRQNFMADWLLVLEQQVQVYLAFRLFAKQMEHTGYPLAYPVFAKQRAVFAGAGQEPAAAGQKQEVLKESPHPEENVCGRQEAVFEITEGYDLALFLKSMYSGQQVVCNDARYDSGEAFLVVTGPNQGGKTTFARSIGQIVYFALMGLEAPCKAAVLPFFNGILTHFSVEESLETGRGKLKEELVRLEPMMHMQEMNKFVVINELFTTAATYDAYIMGKRVMEHFMNRECLGIYVTHIQELADEQKIGAGGCHIVSLSACVDEADSHIRTYKIVRRPAAGAGYAQGLVEKYHLTYPELKERLKERLNMDEQFCLESPK